MSDLNDSEEPVGYGHPPKHTRFKKGTSGNPSGKKKKSVTLEAALQSALANEVQVSIGGKKLKKPVAEIIIGKAVNKALEGDVRFMKLVLEHGSRLKPEEIEDDKALQPHHLQMLRDLLDEMEDLGDPV